MKAMRQKLMHGIVKDLLKMPVKSAKPAEPEVPEMEGEPDADEGAPAPGGDKKKAMNAAIHAKMKGKGAIK